MSLIPCPRCGSTNRDSARFCTRCGATLTKTLVGGRYLVQTTAVQADQPPVYEALDTWCCAACGALLPGPPPPSGPCTQCAADPVEPMPLQLSAHPSPPTADPDKDENETWLYEPDQDTWYKAYYAVPEVDWFPDGLRLHVGAAADLGRRSTGNEDAVLVHTAVRILEDRLYTQGLLAVADGMGGHSAGEVASRTVVDSLLASLAPRLGEMAAQGSDAQQQVLQQAIARANERLAEVRQEQQIDDLGTTVTAALVLDGRAIVANVGDSRTYLLRCEQLTAITEDHSVVYGLLQRGKIAADEIYTHPQRNQIYRCLEGKERPKVDTFECALEPGDRLLLCSDGLWEMVRDPRIQEVLRTTADPQAACDTLVAEANAAGGEDNISVIVADVWLPGQRSVDA